MKNLILLATILIAVVGLAYFGFGAYSERAVYSAVVTSILDEANTESKAIVKKNVFISRPITCSINSKENESIGKDLLANYNSVNRSAKPIPLTSLEGVVTVVSKQDTDNLHEASYAWAPNDKKVIWVSRVGFNRLYSEAAICLGTIGRRHAWGTLFYLKKINGQWVIDGEYNAQFLT